MVPHVSPGGGNPSNSLSHVPRREGPLSILISKDLSHPVPVHRREGPLSSDLKRFVPPGCPCPHALCTFEAPPVLEPFQRKYKWEI